MTDINNNYNTNINRIPAGHFIADREEVPAFEIHDAVKQEKEIKNLDNAHAAVVGRSMIKKMQKPPVNPELLANIKDDLARLDANFNLVKKADLLFDAAIARGYSYEKAAEISDEFVSMNI